MQVIRKRIITTFRGQDQMVQLIYIVIFKELD